ncbi:hypothetical protein GCM10009651_26880 [Microbacterium natoriense]|uniref:hypothetical protein n=1 Tax=Microbacterium natoriense TaxID=284570 RepID=UPI0031DB92A7
MSTDDYTAPPAPTVALEPPAAATATVDPSPAAAMAAASAPAPPRTRWAAIIWGTLFAVIAGNAIFLLADDARREGIAGWMLDLTPMTVTSFALLVAGGLVLLLGAIGLIRRVQRRAASRTP